MCIRDSGSGAQYPLHHTDRSGKAERLAVRLRCIRDHRGIVPSPRRLAHGVAQCVLRRYGCLWLVGMGQRFGRPATHPFSAAQASAVARHWCCGDRPSRLGNEVLASARNTPGHGGLHRFLRHHCHVADELSLIHIFVSPALNTTAI